MQSSAMISLEDMHVQNVDFEFILILKSKLVEWQILSSGSFKITPKYFLITSLVNVDANLDGKKTVLLGFFDADW